LRNHFIINSNLKISSFIENAGNSYLFKIGELIGRQVELYQEHERQRKATKSKIWDLLCFHTFSSELEVYENIKA